jgi:hypothetical protein
MINYSNECFFNCANEIAIIFKDKEVMKESGRGRGGEGRGNPNTKICILKQKIKLDFFEN